MTQIITGRTPAEGVYSTGLQVTSTEPGYNK